MPAATHSQSISPTPSRSAPGISSTAPPMIDGMDSRKEKSAAVRRSSPANSAPAIVEPERDTPGSTPTACIAPTASASCARMRRRLRTRERGRRSRSHPTRMQPVNRKHTPR